MGKAMLISVLDVLELNHYSRFDIGKLKSMKMEAYHDILRIDK